MTFFERVKYKTALLTAAESGDLCTVQFLVQAQPELVDQKSFYSNAPLHNAAANGHKDVVEYLVEFGGAEVDILDVEGKTPLWRATNNGHIHVVQWLVEHGKANVDVQDAENRQTPLHVACAKGYTELVEYLVLQARASVYIEDKCKDTPLSVALRTGNVAILQCIKYPKAYTEIPKAEHRGITLKQLKEVVRQIRLRCRGERWTSTNPAKAGCRLQPEEVTLYDLVKHYILPITEHQQCSYMEAVATKEQLPQWFVSHWWGGSVLNFVTCLERHAHDRALQEDTVYWVCAYAINQHEIAGDFGSNPRESPFYKAMQLTEGTISVLDRESVTYSRIWCGFEIYTALRDFGLGGNEEEGRKRYLYDVYVLVKGEGKDKAFPVGLADGVVEVDKRTYWAWAPPNDEHHVRQDLWLGNKARRERSFPVSSCIKALDVQLQKAEASRDEDKRRILNCMIGNLEDLDEDPPEYHPIYEEVNSLLRAKFAVSAYRRILDGGNTHALQLVRKALTAAPLDRLEISFQACNKFRKEAISFLESLPECLESLDLEYGMNAFESSNEFAVGISRLSRLESFALDCRYCPDLSCLSDLWKEIGQLSRLRKLRLIMFPHRDLTSLDGLTEALRNLPLLECLELSFGAYQSLGAKGIGKAIAGAQGAVYLYRKANDSTGGRLGGALEILSLDTRQKGSLNRDYYRKANDSAGGDLGGVLEPYESFDTVSLGMDFYRKANKSTRGFLGGVLESVEAFERGSLGMDLCRKAKDSTGGVWDVVRESLKEGSLKPRARRMMHKALLGTVDVARRASDVAGCVANEKEADEFRATLDYYARCNGTVGPSFSVQTILKLCVALASKESIHKLFLDLPGPLSKPLKKVKNCQDLEIALEDFRSGTW